MSKMILLVLAALTFWAAMAMWVRDDVQPAAKAYQSLIGALQVRSSGGHGWPHTNTGHRHRDHGAPHYRVRW